MRTTDMDRLRRLRRTALTAALLAATGVPAGAGGAGIEKKADSLLPLQKKLAEHRNRSLAWTRMAYFDEAARELGRADRVFQALQVLVGQQGGGAKPAGATGWDLGFELTTVRMRARAHTLVLDQFKLPADTMGFIQAVPYKKVEKPLYAVLYTVRPKGLTKETIAADVMRYYPTSHVRGSRSAVATYAAKPPSPGKAGPTYEKVAEVAVPEGFTPFLVRQNYGGVLLVQMTSHDGLRAVPYDPTGAMLLHDGKLAHLPAGPCKGPVVVTPRKTSRIHALATNGLMTALFALKKTDQGAVIAQHNGRLLHWDYNTTFEGKHITEIAHHGARGWQKEFSAAAGRRINGRQAVRLAGLYVLRRHLQRGRIYPYAFSVGDGTPTFDAKTRQWRVGYRWGRIEIAGGRRTVVLDEHGKLVGISEFIVPR